MDQNLATELRGLAQQAGWHVEYCGANPANPQTLCMVVVRDRLRLTLDCPAAGDDRQLPLPGELGREIEAKAVVLPGAQVLRWAGETLLLLSKIADRDPAQQ